MSAAGVPESELVRTTAPHLSLFTLVAGQDYHLAVRYQRQSGVMSPYSEVVRASPTSQASGLKGSRVLQGLLVKKGRRGRRALLEM